METNEEIIDVGMRDLRKHGVTMLTLGQYLQPSRHHLPVQRYVRPDEFEYMKEQSISNGLYPRRLWTICSFVLSCDSSSWD